LVRICELSRQPDHLEILLAPLAHLTTLRLVISIRVERVQHGYGFESQDFALELYYGDLACFIKGIPSLQTLLVDFTDHFYSTDIITSADCDSIVDPQGHWPCLREL
jgi:hypothetical protein